MKRLLGGMCLSTALVAGGCAGASSSSPPASRADRTVPTAAPAQAPSAAPVASAPVAPTATHDVVPPSAPVGPVQFNAMAAAAEDRVIARVGGKKVTFGELLRPLMEAHGLDFTLQLVQLKTAQTAAEQAGVTVSQEDITTEREFTLSRLFKDVEEKTREQIEQAEKKGDRQQAEQLRADLMRQRDTLIDQFLAQQYATTRNYMSRQEFDILLTTNAYLRKLAEATPAIQAPIPEEELRKDFGTLYGEKAVVRHIQLANVQEVAEAKRRLASRPFAEVAAEMSRNRQTAPLGGELPPLTQNSEEIPPAFRDAAFRMKPGEVSDPIQTGDAFHLIKLEQRLEPKAVKFESVEPTLRQQRHDRMVQFAMNELRRKLADRARDSMKIEDPDLQRQYQARLEQRKLREEDAIKRQMQREREGEGEGEPAGGATTRPAPAGPGPYTQTTRPSVTGPRPPGFPSLSEPPTPPATTTEVPPAGPASGGTAVPSLAPTTRPAAAPGNQ